MTGWQDTGRAIFIGLGLTALLFAIGFASQLSRPTIAAATNEPDQNIATAPKSDLRVYALGSPSCAGQACHAAVNQDYSDRLPGLIDLRPNPHRWRTSFLEWHDHDPHQKSFQVLQNDLSRQIVTQWSHGKNQDASQESACLVCHANPSLAERMDVLARSLQQEGVSCEACHGDASNWRNQHYLWTATTHRDQVYASVQMHPLYRPEKRAEICAGCHVGSPALPGIPAREVTHDMIAAGHPRLAFEFAAYSRNLGQHWEEKTRTARETSRPAEFAAELFWLGMQVQLRQSVELLKETQTRWNTPQEKTWPELAYFNCFSCHHDLGGSNWRKELPFAQSRSVGSMHWQQSLLQLPTLPGLPFQQTKAELQSMAGPLQRGIFPQLGQWQRLQQQAKRDCPTPENAWDLLIRYLQFYRQNPQHLQTLDWDGANQLFQACLVVYQIQQERIRRQGMPTTADALLNQQFEQLHRLLRFPDAPNRVNSPSSFGKSEFIRILPSCLDRIIQGESPS